METLPPPVWKGDVLVVFDVNSSPFRLLFFIKHTAGKITGPAGVGLFRIIKKERGEEMNKKLGILISLLMAVVLLGACAGQTEEAAVVSEPVLTMSGAATASWTEDELKALPQTSAEYTDKEGVVTVYEGVALNDLLTAAGVSEYTTLSMIASDDYSADVSMEELSACATCIVVFEEDGTLRSVLPDFSGKQQVKDLVGLSVQ